MSSSPQIESPRELRTLALAVFAGIAGGVLFDGDQWGANLAVFAGVVALAYLTCSRLGGSPPNAGSFVLAASAFAWAGTFAWRASPWLHTVTWLALVATIYLAYLHTLTGSLASIPLSLLWRGAPGAAGVVARRPLRLATSDLAWREAVRSPLRSQLAGVFRGLLFSGPLVLLFGALLMHADVRFSDLVTRTATVDIDVLCRYAIAFVVCYWIAAVFLGSHPLEGGRLQRSGDTTSSRSAGPSISTIEASTVLLVLELLFGLYLYVQATYLVGGDALVQSDVPLTYAEYARGGFFELVAVAVLALPLLIMINMCVDGRAPGQLDVVWVLSMVMIALIFLMEASALHRMALYANAYGLTNLRIFTTAFMLWLLVSMILAAATVLRGAADRFVPAAALSGLLVGAGLHLLDPDAWIVDQNLRRATETRPVDLSYLLSLSADAIPVLYANLDSLSDAERSRVERNLRRRGESFESAGWRDWNWSRARAAALVAGSDADHRGSSRSSAE